MKLVNSDQIQPGSCQIVILGEQFTFDGESFAQTQITSNEPKLLFTMGVSEETLEKCVMMNLLKNRLSSAGVSQDMFFDWIFYHLNEFDQPVKDINGIETMQIGANYLVWITGDPDQAMLALSNLVQKFKELYINA